MKIKVINIEQNINNLYIEFITDYGSAKGIWCDKSIPSINNEYHVEIDLNNVVILNSNVQNLTIYDNISCKDNKINVFAIVEEIKSDGYAALSIGIEKLYVILNESKNISIGNTIKISIEIKNVLIYPIYY